MVNGGINASDVDVNIQFLPALPSERLRFRLAGFDFAAHELPEQRPGLVRRPLADQETLPVPQKRRHHLYGVCPLIYN